MKVQAPPNVTFSPLEPLPKMRSILEAHSSGGGENHLGDLKIDVLPTWELNFKHFLFFMIFEGSLEIAVLPAWELNFRENCTHIYDFSIT